MEMGKPFPTNTGIEITPSSQTTAERRTENELREDWYKGCNYDQVSTQERHQRTKKYCEKCTNEREKSHLERKKRENLEIINHQKCKRHKENRLAQNNKSTYISM
jgi:hypothetical protein